MQEWITPHPNRVKCFKRAIFILKGIEAVKHGVTATAPPELEGNYFEFLPFNRLGTNVIRASTDRPEISHHVLNVSKMGFHGIHRDQAILKLVTALQETLGNDERGMVFVMSKEHAQKISKDLKCAVHYAAEPNEPLSNGHSPEDNFDMWARGNSPIIVSTPTLQQGIDLPSVKWVLFVDSAYSFQHYVQGSGRGGRNGSAAWAFFLCELPGTCKGTREEVRKYPHLTETQIHERNILTMASRLQSYTKNVDSCRRLIITRSMDGNKLMRTCSNVPNSNKCQVCEPDSEMAVLVKNALAAALQSPIALSS